MTTVTKKAYGKVNLFLSVGEKRADGRHNVETVMCRVGLYDTVSVTRTDEALISVTTDADLPVNEENIAYLAAKCYFERANINGGVKIHIEKRIPIKGGMGGGSSDAAAVLEALNELYGALDFSELKEIAASLGADVPFFLYGDKVMLGKGTGTELTEVGTLSVDMYGVFVRHGEKLSTGKAYGVLDEIRGVDQPVKSSERLCNAVLKNDVLEVAGAIENDFEVCSSTFGEVERELCRVGCIKAFLCGSGPTVCGIFDSEEKACKASNGLRYDSFVAKIGV